MRRLREPFRRHSPVPPASAAEGIRTSTSSDALASVIKVLEIAEKALDGLSVPGLKQVISTIHIVLQSVEVKVIDYLHLGWRLLMAIWFFLRNPTIIKGR